MKMSTKFPCKLSSVYSLIASQPKKSRQTEWDKKREKRLLIGCRGWLEEEASDDAKDKVNEKWPRSRQRDGEGRKKSVRESHLMSHPVLLWPSSCGSLEAHSFVKVLRIPS